MALLAVNRASPDKKLSVKQKSMKPIILISLAVFFLQGCGTSYQTSYQSDSFSGGYSDSQLDENVFKVSFRGNGSTRRDRVADFTLLRSAELAIQNGYNYFVIIDANSYTSTSIHTTPAITNYVYGNSISTTTGGQTYNISKPSSSNTIVCFKEKPSMVFSYNANFIHKSLTEKYDIM